jgi:hypothetical protein
LKLSGYDKKVTYNYITGMTPASHEIHTTWTDIDGNDHDEWINVGAKEFKRYERALARGKANYLKVLTDENGDTVIGDMLTADSYSTVPLGQRYDGSHRAFSIFDPKTGVRGDSSNTLDSASR